MNRLPENIQWAIHNIIGHPLYGILCLCGYEDLGEAVHDATVPETKESK